VTTSTTNRAQQRATQAAADARPPAVTLTGRGGIAAIFAVTLLAQSLALGIGLGPVPGVLFVITCMTAAALTRRSDQLTLVVSPPVVFLTVTVITQTLSSLGDASVLRSAVAGVLLALASGAPWLFLGTLLTLGISLTRGLPGNVADLRARTAHRPLVRRTQPADDFDEDPVRWDVQP
jgi:hypothetical protein